MVSVPYAGLGSSLVGGLPTHETKLVDKEKLNMHVV